MKLLIVSTAPFIYIEDSVYAYSPYVEELVIWSKYADTISFCCPVWGSSHGLLMSEMPFEFKHHFRLKDFNLNSTVAIFKAIFFIFYNVIVLFKSMIWAEHIHLRCPGNVGLLGCLIQVFFPSKTKTAKYAGNWDSQSRQPWSYRLQKWILNNSFLTRNMKVLVYGEWPNQSKNIMPFFTATYKEDEKKVWKPKEMGATINFIFVGTLSKGKKPLYAVQLVEALHKKGYNVFLNLYGEGTERVALEKYISEHNLGTIVMLNGNQSQAVLKEAYQQSHFVMLPSVSEGWPKAIAEGMFWGAVPLATKVSCIPFMLDYGRRGVILSMDLEKDSQQIQILIKKQAEFNLKSQQAYKWSNQYTLTVFEQEIKKIILNGSSFKN
ncbi:glycosyltransferase [Flavobacterium sp. NG2]|uniref:glycosyltransferase n=1 Tax=Flavobacterium sp. NG2 TaxID=3097547 RepID=UPI002A7FA650|nr:glycosyltransferase [Flavobacterium sp. NG2]WPR71593.1 glycosyltransferase [Flavobacterium sp. NG2]